MTRVTFRFLVAFSIQTPNKQAGVSLRDAEAFITRYQRASLPLADCALVLALPASVLGDMLVRYPRPWLGVLTAAVVATATRIPSQQGFVSAPCRAQAPCERQPLPRDHRHVMMPLSCVSPSSSSSSSVVSMSTARAEGWRKAVLPFLPPERCRSASPAESLRRGEWFKLICGASFEVLTGLSEVER